MKRVSQAELRRHLGRYMDQVRDTRSPLHVTGRNGRAVVMLPVDEYEGLIETLHLLANPANSARLFHSIAEADAGEVIERDV
ncbi:MAG: type II toxin-antitoxin system prevent-host-death family antitoxin [Hyphomicrobiales bacterium]|nr:type II toxin-antitoxin system prevent-host-death family antitoxin [Hyphomicrobiales bacterium]MBV8826757.1 type II toxin-antitoxin system prevent-host-death family antitoxin [Hyphomicrobiales bacterium]